MTEMLIAPMLGHECRCAQNAHLKAGTDSESTQFPKLKFTRLKHLLYAAAQALPTISPKTDDDMMRCKACKSSTGTGAARLAHIVLLLLHCSGTGPAAHGCSASGSSASGSSMVSTCSSSENLGTAASLGLQQDEV